jgi:hypothetical protein
VLLTGDGAISTISFQLNFGLISLLNTASLFEQYAGRYNKTSGNDSSSLHEIRALQMNIGYREIFTGTIIGTYKVAHNRICAGQAA